MTDSEKIDYIISLITGDIQKKMKELSDLTKKPVDDIAIIQNDRLRDEIYALRRLLISTNSHGISDVDLDQFDLTQFEWK